MALPHLNDPDIQAYRHKWLEAAFAPGKIEAVVTFGTPAFDAWTAFKATPAGQSLPATVFHHKALHPTADKPGGPISRKDLLDNWNVALQSFHATIQHPDVTKPLVLYGSDFTAAELPEIPSRDFPTDGPPALDADQGFLGDDVPHSGHRTSQHLHRGAVKLGCGRATVSCLAALALVLLVGCGGDRSRAPDGGVAAPDAGARGDAGPPTARGAALCAAIEAFVADNDLPGAVAATRFPDGSTHTCAAGVSNLADATPLSTRDLFQIGSVTKTFTATIVLLLAEEGLLSLEDHLSRWVPGFDASDPTLAQMLNHTSGLGEYLFDPALTAMQDRAHTQDELIALARTEPIERMPGERFHYSNTNYLLMGAVIEAASGRPWYELVRERLLDPLGMTDTYAWGFEARPGGAVHGYVREAGTWIDATLAMHPTVASSAGCMVSSATDLSRWAEALYGGEVLRPASLRAMTDDYRVPHAYDGGVYTNAFVGLANFIETGDTYGTFYGHGGGMPGFLTNMRYMVSEGRVLVIFINGVDRTADPSPINALTNDAWIALLI